MKDTFAEETTGKNISKENTSSPRIAKRFSTLLAQRWPEYLVEIIVVIIGITISFAISKYQEDSRNRKLAHVYLEDLKEDIKSDIQSLDIVIQKTDSVIRSGQSLLNQSDAAKISLTKKDLVNLVRAIIARPNFISKNATFSSLKTSANFQLIEDIQLKTLLFEYDQDYQTIKAMELAELQATVTIAGPYLLKSIPLTDSKQSSYWLEKLDIESTLLSVEFMNNIALRIGNRMELLNSYKDILVTARQIDEGIQRNLE
jgi:hypothetical protein